MNKSLYLKLNVIAVFLKGFLFVINLFMLYNANEMNNFIME